MALNCVMLIPSLSNKRNTKNYYVFNNAPYVVLTMIINGRKFQRKIGDGKTVILRDDVSFKRVLRPQGTAHERSKGRSGGRVQFLFVSNYRTNFLI